LVKHTRERDLGLGITGNPGMSRVRWHRKSGGIGMIERIEWELISRRRMFSLLGVAVTLGLSLPPPPALAPTPHARGEPPSAGTQTPEGAAPTPGTQRRHKRRQRRAQRRHGTQPASNAPASGAPAPSGPTPAPSGPAPSAPAPGQKQ